MKRFTGLFLALLTIAFLTSSTSNASIPFSVTRTIAGTVIDQRSNPASFVFVSLVKLNDNAETIFQKIIRTNAEGKFDFNDIEILSSDVIRVGAYRNDLNPDLATVSTHNSADETGDIGAYANDIKGVVDNTVVDPSVSFIQLSPDADNSHLVLHVAASVNTGTGSSIRPYHPPVNGGEIGTYPAPGSGSGNRIRLYQNFPNPFNPQTKIVYSVLQQSLVTLKVYDMSGKEIMQLVNETKSPGNYQVVFNASNLASGFYIYKLDAGGEVQINKMSLIK